MLTKEVIESRCHRDLSSKCIGPLCMAWRWSRAKETEGYILAVQARMKSHNETFNVATQKVFAESATVFEKTEGYCGLAGKPE